MSSVYSSMCQILSCLSNIGPKMQLEVGNTSWNNICEIPCQKMKEKSTITYYGILFYMHT